jgi:putative N6-adenine-specific DNA methylase
MAQGLVPGRHRHFAFEGFPCFEAAALASCREPASAEIGSSRPPAPILAYDRDRRAVERARRNLERAGLSATVELTLADARAYKPPFPDGLLIANPPYGRRLGARAEANALLEAFGQQLRRHFSGYRIALLVPRSVPEKALGLRVIERVALQNGGLPVSLWIAVRD